LELVWKYKDAIQNGSLKNNVHKNKPKRSAERLELKELWKKKNLKDNYIYFFLLKAVTYLSIAIDTEVLVTCA